LLVSCPDRKGIVAALAQLLYGHGANIVDAQQHTDAQAGQFFQRIVFDMSEMHTDRVALENAIAEVATRFGMIWRLQYAERKKNVAIFVSRYGHCLHDLLTRHRLGELDCAVRLVVANHADLEDVARHFGVEFQHVPVAAENKKHAEERAEALLQESRPSSSSVTATASSTSTTPSCRPSSASGRTIRRTGGA
jgi:formyltetrahydrofolate deformylase